MEDMSYVQSDVASPGLRSASPPPCLSISNYSNQFSDLRPTSPHHTSSHTYISFSEEELVDTLGPGPGEEAEFQVENNKFAFYPGQLGKLYYPKSLAALHALGGIDGIGRRLKTDRKYGRSINEEASTLADRKRVFSDNRLPAPKASAWKRLTPGPSYDNRNLKRQSRLYVQGAYMRVPFTTSTLEMCCMWSQGI